VGAAGSARGFLRVSEGFTHLSWDIDEAGLIIMEQPGRKVHSPGRGSVADEEPLGVHQRRGGRGRQKFQSNMFGRL